MSQNLLADCGPKGSLISFGIRECLSESKEWNPLSVPCICCLGQLSWTKALWTGLPLLAGSLGP